MCDCEILRYFNKRIPASAGKCVFVSPVILNETVETIQCLWHCPYKCDNSMIYSKIYTSDESIQNKTDIISSLNLKFTFTAFKIKIILSVEILKFTLYIVLVHVFLQFLSSEMEFCADRYSPTCSAV